MTEADWLASDDAAAMLRFVTENPDHDNITCCRSDRKLRLFACACCRQVWDGVPCRRCKGKRDNNPTGKVFDLLAGQRGKRVGCPDCSGSRRVGGLTDPRSRAAVLVAERFADGEAAAGELLTAHQDTYRVNSTVVDVAFIVTEPDRDIARAAHFLADWHEAINLPPAVQAALLREVVGNPFLPQLRIERLPGGGFGFPWLTPRVLAIARKAYDDRDFAALPILADALEDAGCVEETLLRHLRGEERCPNCLGRGTMNQCDDAKCDCGKIPCPVWTPLRTPHIRGCWALDLLLGKS